MKTKAAVQIGISSLSIAFAMLLFAPSSFGQGGQVYQSQLGPVQEELHGQDYVPEIGQKGSMNPESTPYRHDINEDDSTDLGKPMHDQDDTTTIYEKDGQAKKDEASVFKGEHRGRITHGKRTEHFIVTDSKPAKIKQTKDGSSDATESTGVFKDSLLDVASSDSLSLGVEKTNATAEARPRPSASPKARPSASPAASVKPISEESSNFSLSLGITESNPAPSPSH